MSLSEKKGREAGVPSSDLDIEGQLVEVLTDNPGADRFVLAETIRQADPLLGGRRLHDIVERAFQRAHGLGPLARVMGDDAISEIMINGPGPIWLDRSGVCEISDVVLDDTDLQLLIDRILDPLGLRVDRLRPMVDARLPDGSRVNIVIPPLAQHGPVITIRRFAPKAIPLSAFGSDALHHLLTHLVEERRTIVVSGGTGTGKTTLLNALAEEFRPTERVVVIEDTTELNLPGPHVVRLEARPENSEGVGSVTIRDLVRNSLRMRPDRIVVGEVRAGEALDLLMALNTGHSGSLSTCHANHPNAALHRLVHLALLGDVDLPPEIVEAQVAEAVDIVVHVAREGPRRYVSEVAEVTNDRPLMAETIWRAGS